MTNSSDQILAERLADAAGAAIRPLFRGEWSEERKPDTTFVTEADRAAEAAMRWRSRCTSISSVSRLRAKLPLGQSITSRMASSRLCVTTDPFPVCPYHPTR